MSDSRAGNSIARCQAIRCSTHSEETTARHVETRITREKFCSIIADAYKQISVLRPAELIPVPDNGEVGAETDIRIISDLTRDLKWYGMK